MQRAQVAAVPKYQCRRQQGLVQQAPCTIDIGQHAVEQARALHDALFDAGPVLRVDDQRQRLERPRSRRRDRRRAAAFERTHQVVRHAVRANLLRDRRAVPLEGCRRIAAQRGRMLEEALPRRPQRAFGGAQFVPVVVRGRIAGIRRRTTPRQRDAKRAGWTRGGCSADRADDHVSRVASRACTGIPGSAAPPRPPSVLACDRSGRSAPGGGSPRYRR